uniref:Uncharacterized protein n=1 Tax=Paraburkholderia sprentiae WSM5005 TaxID=754502 RepID=A0A1I9YDZ9_9BURK
MQTPPYLARSGLRSVVHSVPSASKPSVAADAIADPRRRQRIMHRLRDSKSLNQPELERVGL